MPRTSPTNSINSSLSSGERFGLDPTDSSKILVYTYRDSVKPLSQDDLCKMLDNNRNLRCSKLAIPRGNSRIDIRQEDLYPEDQREKYASLPNAKNNLTSIMLGWRLYLPVLWGKYENMYIVSQSGNDAGEE
jgi:hypothetical protein